MKPIARFSAPRAVFLVATLELITCASYAADFVKCSDGQSIAGHYIVRAKDDDHVSTASFQNSRLIHREIHATSGGDNESAQQLTEKSTVVVSTFASELNSIEVSDLQQNPNVLSIEEDCLVHIESPLLPNDPIPVQYQNARAQLNLPEAWAIKTDSSPIIVAVSDTGVDMTHEDLAQNIWTNTAELNGQPGVDDDGNGCIDDLHGCDFGDYDGDPSPPTTAQGGHGTHVAGIIGAVGNNSRGVTGVAWRTQLLVAKGFDSGGYAAVSDLLNTIYYSVNNGARVINCSWGADRTPTQAERDAFQFALDHGVLAVVTAGNSSMDASRSSPAALDSVLTVGSVNSQDQVSAFSNFGPHVPVYAPGGDAGATNEFIYSTLPGNQYGPLRGTSMAAPFVSGIAALVFSVNPKLSAVDVRNIIVTTSRSVTSRIPDGTSATIRIPDAAAALTLASTYSPTPFGVTPQPTSPAYQSPKADHAAPEFVQTSSTSSCALHRTTQANPSVLILFILPIACAFSLRRRTAA